MRQYLGSGYSARAELLKETAFLLLHFKKFSFRVSVFRFSKRSFGGGDVKSDVQSVTHRPIWQKGVGVAGHEETLDEGHGERCFPAHPVEGNAPALRRRRDSFNRRWVVVVGSDEA